MRVELKTCTVLVLLFLAGCGRTPPNFTERPPLEGHSREVTSVAFAPDGQTLASRGADSIQVWDLAKGEKRLSFPSDGADFGSVAFATTGDRLATEQIGQGAIAWDLAQPDQRIMFPFPADPRAVPKGSPTRGWGLAYSPDGKLLVGGGSHGVDDGFLAFWNGDGAVGVETAPLKRPITTLAFTPDGRTIVSGSMDGKITIWDRATRQQRLGIDANRSYLSPVVISPDGRFVATANDARWVKFWDLTTGREAGIFKGHIKAVLSIAFHPDGRTLVSGDSGGTLFVWDVPSRKMMTRLESSERGKVWSLAFRADGKMLASGGEDKKIHLWDVTEPVKAN